MLWISTLIVVCLMAAVLGWQEYGTRRQIPPLITPKTRVEVFEGTVEVQTADATRVLHNGERLVDSEVEEASGVAEPSPTEAQIAQATEPVHEPTSVQVRIVDALGDPISGSWLRIGDQTIPVLEGTIELPEQAITANDVVAGATGFAETAQNLRAELAQGQKSVDIQLEYLCAFDVRVMRGQSPETRRPAGAGVEVRVYQGPKPIRPPSETLLVRYSGNWAANSARIVRDQIGLHVLDTLISPIADDPLIQENNEEINHKPGDVITQIGVCVWETGGEEGTQSQDWWNARLYRSRIRIWDTLAVYSTKQPYLTQYAGMAVQVSVTSQKGVRKSLNTCRFNPDVRGPCVAVGTTDENSHCRFENLPAGIYLLQAMHQGARSEFETVLPVEREVTLYLAATAYLGVSVRAYGMEDEPWWLDRSKGSIEGANVVLRRKDSGFSGGFYTTKTNEYGGASFQELPFGTYQITAEPPASFGAIPAQKTVSATLDLPRQKIGLEFDSSTLFKVTGKVLEAETHSPVENYILELGTVTRDIFLSNGMGMSAADGSFTIARIPNGRYFLRTRPATFKHFDYVSPEYVSEPDNEESKFGLLIEVNGADVNGIEYLVQKSVETRFSGRVVGPDGKPIELPRVTFKRGKGFRVIPRVINQGESHTITTKYTPGGKIDYYKGGESIEYKGETKTDREGCFELSVRSLAYNDTCTGTLLAEYDPDDDYVPERKGNLDVEFRPGDTLENLEIVLSVSKDDYSTITGEILTEDGDPLIVSYVNAVQMEGVRSKGVIFNGNQYRVDWAEPGQVEIQVHPKRDSGYCEKFFHVDVPETPSMITYNPVLERAAQISGRVIDRDRNPVANVSVLLCATPSYYHADTTDEEGRFEISQACPKAVYDISVNTRGTKKDLSDAVSLGSLLGVRPPAADIVIMVNRP